MTTQKRLLVVTVLTVLGLAGLAPGSAAEDASSSSPVSPTARAATAAPVVTKVTPASGMSTGGTTVTVRGRNLAGATRVLFGSAKGTRLRVLSSRALTVRAPARRQPGAVSVRVVTAGGTSRPARAARFTYRVPAPRVTSIAPAHGSTSGGTIVTIRGSRLKGATRVLFGATPGKQISVKDDGRLTVRAPARPAGRVDVRVVTRGGTSAKVAAGRFTFVAPGAAVLLPAGLASYSAATNTLTPIAGAETDVQLYDVDAFGRVYYDRGAAGLSQYDPATGESLTVSAADVLTLRAAADGVVYYAIANGAPETVGTYVFDPRLGTSTRYTSEVATSIAAVANGVSFGNYSSGFHRYDPATKAFTLVSATPPTFFDAAGDGSTVFATIGGALVRFRRNAVGGFQKTVVTDTNNVVAYSVSESGYVYLDLSSAGTYQYRPDTGALKQIDARNPVFVVSDPAGNAYLDYAGNGGTERYVRATGGFEKLSTNPDAFFGLDDVDIDGGLYVDYNAAGLYRFDPATSARDQPFAGEQIATDNPTSTIGNR